MLHESAGSPNLREFKSGDGSINQNKRYCRHQNLLKIKYKYALNKSTLFIDLHIFF